MKLRSLSAILAVMFLTWASIVAAASPPRFAGVFIHSAAMAQVTEFDFDGDGIPNDLDPDDDNDGVIDAEDFAQLDPNIQFEPVVQVNPANPNDTGNQAPPPVQINPIASNQDSDGDGIPNDLDPDDTNNAVTDEDEPILEDESTVTVVPSPPSATETPAIAPTAISAETATVESTVAPPVDNFVPDAPIAAEPAPVVNSLPSTGSGVENALPSLVILLVAVIGLVAVRVRSNKSPK